jgi:alpha-glucosidase
VIHGDIGNYITIVRKDRNSSDWYLGSITDDTGRMLSTPLYFLEDDITYVAEIYADGDDADWSAKPLDIEIESKLVNSRTLLTLRLAPGGGQAIRFRPANDRDIDELKWY